MGHVYLQRRGYTHRSPRNWLNFHSICEIIVYSVKKEECSLSFDTIVNNIDSWVWGWVLIVLILATGLLLTIRTRCVQVLHLGKALNYMVKNEEGGNGEVSSFGALCTALSATIGTGNIVGVATAISDGGPGALLWMVVAAFFGMATKYAEGVLAVRYRFIDKEQHVLGGPFYYIEHGLGEKYPKIRSWKWLGKLFALFGALAGLLGIGTLTQTNGITSAAEQIFQNSKILFQSDNKDITLVAVITGLIVTLCAALVILGGVNRISKFSEIVVPFMALFYVAFAILILVLNGTKIPATIALICKTAFAPRAFGGTLKGITLKMAIQYGIGRGVFSNEAGLGSAPIASATAKTNSPVRQGLVTMMGTFVTVIICIMTGLAITITGAWNPENTGGQTLLGFDVVAEAWRMGLPFLGNVCVIILSVCLAFFAFTTIIGWDFYAERCFEYLVGSDKKQLRTVFRILYIVAVAAGPYLTISAVWKIADIFNGLMAFPNLIALVLLSGVVSVETKKYFDDLKNPLKARRTYQRKS